MKRNKHQKFTRQGVLLYPTTRFICDSSPCRVQKTENNMSQVHEHLSPETYGITMLPIIEEECEHKNVVQAEEYYGPEEHQFTVYWYCEDCDEPMDPEDYRGEL